MSQSFNWLVLIPVLFVLWVGLTSPEQKLVSMIGASLFSLIELCYCKITCGHWHTTIEQWLCNILTIPIALDAYKWVIPNMLIRIALMPLDVWSVEILQTILLVSLYGFNPAWNYTGKRGSRLNGAIRLTMFPEWWILGCAIECIFPSLLSLVSL